MMLAKTLRDELAEAKAKADKVMRAAEAENRLLSDEERTQVQQHLDEAKAAHDKIVRAEGDASLRAKFDEFNQAAAQRKATGQETVTRERSRGAKSLGQQFVDSPTYAAIQRGEFRGRQGWSAGAIELEATLLTEDPASGGDLILPAYQPGVLPLLFKRLTIADLIAPGTTDSNLIEYMVETTFTNAAAAVAEGGTKPESALVFDRTNDAVKKIAHVLPVTDEMLEDAPQIRSYIDARLMLGLDLTEEDQLLNGSGSGANIRGILNRTGLQTDLARGSDTNADVIFKQITTIFTNSFLMPDAIVINPTNWQTIVLSKNANGDYYAGGPFQMQRVPMLWGLPTVVTPSIAAGSALPGAFRQGAQVFRRSGVTVEASNSHSTFFVENKTMLRAEKRLALAVYRPAAFGECTGLN